jgi:hypothetical protein
MEEILERLSDLEIIVRNIESRLDYLESENVGTTNEIYELQNKLDILEHPKYISLKKFTLGES